MGVGLRFDFCGKVAKDLKCVEREPNYGECEGLSWCP